MICPITNDWCRTNGCGEKCHKRDCLGYNTVPQYDAKLPVIGTVFKMQGKLWKVKTYGDNGWLGVECQGHNSAFTSVRVEDVQRCLSEY